jgi:SHS2 domain-containing protein
MDSHKPNFTLLDHTADLGIIVSGKDLTNLFEGAAQSMIQIMVRAKPAKKTKALKLTVSGEDLADLMVRWLGEILYLFEGENEVVTAVHIDSISPSHLDASLETVPFDLDLHEMLCEIKAVTYHQIEVAKKDDHWEAKIIFDV